MKRLLLFVLTLAVVFPVAAQTKLTAARRDDRSVDICVANKTCPGTQTIVLTLTNLENCAEPGGTTFHRVLHDGLSIMTLRPIDPDRSVCYSFSYRVIDGVLDPEPDTTFIYRMPCSVRRPVRVLHGSYVLGNYSNPESERVTIGYHFILEKGDTVYAMRRGVVTQVEVDHPSAEMHFSTHSTKLTVEQPDGTFARYICLDPDHIFVREGDVVFPDTPLALAGSYDGETWKVDVQVFFRTSDYAAGDLQSLSFKTRHLELFFTTQEGVLNPRHGSYYHPVVTGELIVRELTKKEMKRLRGNK